MKRHLYSLSFFIYSLTIINISLIFFEIYIENIFIKLAYLLPLFFIFFMVIQEHIETSLNFSYTTWEEKSNMNIDEYYEHTLQKKTPSKPNKLKLMAMGTALYTFVVFFWNMVSSPNGSPVIKNGKYFSQSHTVFTTVTKEEYWELVRMENMMLMIFPLFLSMIGMWKFYQYKKYLTIASNAIKNNTP